LIFFLVLFILSYCIVHCIIPKKLAKGRAKGGAKREGGKAAGEEEVTLVGTEAAVVAETALPRTLVEVVALDPDDGRPTKGAAANAIAAVLPADNQHVIGQADGTQVHVGMDPCLGEEAKERYRKNEILLSGVDPRLLLGVVGAHNLCSMMNGSSIDSMTPKRVRMTWRKHWR
jgi:hypothetical protein